MTDWTGPTPDTAFLDVLDALKARDVDAATMGTPDNPPTGFKRWSDSARRFEVWSGTAWNPLPVGGPWVDWGHAPARLSASQITVTGDTTALYLVGRRCRVITAGGPVVGTITACAYDGVNGWTVVTVALDSGALTTPLSTVSLSIHDTPDALPMIPISRGGTGAGDIASALSALGVPFSGVVSRTTSGAVSLLDRGKLHRCSGTLTLTLPSAATAGAGWTLPVINTGGGVVTLTRAGSDLIGGSVSCALSYQGASLTLVSTGTGWDMIGSVSSAADGFAAQIIGIF